MLLEAKPLPPLSRGGERGEHFLAPVTVVLPPAQGGRKGGGGGGMSFLELSQQHKGRRRGSENLRYRVMREIHMLA